MCARCGIKKYDELPSRVGFIDVDAKRAALSKHMAIVERIRYNLDKAIKLNKQSKIKIKRK